MLSYDPLRKLMKDRGISYYDLYTHYGMNESTVYRIKNDKGITLATLNYFMEIFKVTSIDDLILFIPEKSEKTASSFIEGIDEYVLECRKRLN